MQGMLTLTFCAEIGCEILRTLSVGEARAWCVVDR
jgi:hypothetical protein